MKKKLFVLVILACLGAFSGLAAYRRGLWIPNYPSETRYPVRGIDVSHHQGKIDWTQVGNAKIDFVYIKSTEGGDYKDDKFLENWAESAKAGLKRGAYHFFTFKTPGKLQAKNFIATVPKDADALPPVIDLEYGGNSSDRPSVEAFQKEVRDFIDDVKAAYKSEPVIYTDDPFLRSYLKGFDHSRLWLRDVIARPKNEWMFWQYSELRKVPGIKGFVDQNVFAGSKDEFVILR